MAVFPREHETKTLREAELKQGSGQYSSTETSHWWSQPALLCGLSVKPVNSCLLSAGLGYVWVIHNRKSLAGTYIICDICFTAIETNIVKLIFQQGVAWRMWGSILASPYSKPAGRLSIRRNICQSISWFRCSQRCILYVTLIRDMCLGN